MRTALPFRDHLLGKLRKQIKGRNAGFLLGAGASFLGGHGYPLAAGLWPAIRERMQDRDQRAIDECIARGSATLENALDSLLLRQDDASRLRDRVTVAISEVFGVKKVPLGHHEDFVVRLASRQERRVPVFTLNYDTLMEQAADAKKLALIDGFSGIADGFFFPSAFVDFRGSYELRRGRSVATSYKGIINLYKLHGSLGWHAGLNENLKRIRADMPCEPGWRPLMVPPQYSKAADTGMTPYAALWSDFRAYLGNDATRLLNRLVTIGYGFGDGHVNAVIDSGLARKHFTLVVAAKVLGDPVFARLRQYRNAIVVTESRSSLYGEVGGGVADAWSFEWLSREV